MPSRQVSRGPESHFQNDLRRTPGGKNEKAPTQKQSASLMEVFHERIVAPASGGE
ncbi:MAG TPA: hypothetical protein VF845_12515 [Terriglobales bacterium]